MQICMHICERKPPCMYVYEYVYIYIYIRIDIWGMSRCMHIYIHAYVLIYSASMERIMWTLGF